MTGHRERSTQTQKRHKEFHADCVDSADFSGSDPRRSAESAFVRVEYFATKSAECPRATPTAGKSTRSHSRICAAPEDNSSNPTSFLRKMCADIENSSRSHP